MRILVASPIDADAIEHLSREHDLTRAFNAHEDLLRSEIRDRDVLIFRSGVMISAGLLADAAELRLMVRAGSGLDNVDLESARERGIRLVRVPGSSAQPVAEFTFALMLSLARKVALADRLLRQGHWPKGQLGGPLLKGRTLGIVGAGNIGAQVGEMGAAWGMRVIGVVEHPSDESRARLRARGIELADFDTVVAEADFLSLHVPLTDATRHMINARVLSHMKRGSFLINLARGGVVDEEALYPELTEGGNLLGAALDVHEREGEGTMSPFAELPNVVLTPHIGAMALDAQRQIGERVLELVGAFDDGRLDAETRDGELVV
jgi:D-3-phosphoglycerate dehydrogenase / 2-oxoglutarate reductase